MVSIATQVENNPVLDDEQYELLDFLLLCQEDFWREVFFLEPAAMAARVWVMTS